MSDTTSFSYERFMCLSGSPLVNYAEPFVNTAGHAIPESAYGLLLSDLTRLDEEHTVYALEICMALKARQFASVVAGFLAHPASAVSCTAYRLLKRIPRDSMDANLLAKIAATPVIDLFAHDVRNGKQIIVGTNEQFIRDLVTTFAGDGPEKRILP
jgi:hypothetical protein